MRLSVQDQKLLAEMSKVYGAPNPRAFLREILQVMLSGDAERLRGFNTRLAQGVGKHMAEQMAFKLNETLDETPPPPRKRAKKKGARAKRRP